MGADEEKVVMNGDEDFDEESSTALVVAQERGFTTFTDASPKDPHFENTSDLRVRLAYPGESHWPKISPLDTWEMGDLEKLWQVIVICMTSLVDYISATVSERMTPCKIISSR
jgi:hypothetical protein